MIDCIDEQLHGQNNNNTDTVNRKTKFSNQVDSHHPMFNMTQHIPEFFQPQTNQNNTTSLKQQILLPVYQQQQQLLLDVAQGVPSTNNIATSNNLSSKPNQQQHTGNELIGYYFGSISRETAEWILKTHGNQLDGSYLLRSSGPNDDFVLSLMVVNNNNSMDVLHYKIVETEDSFVALHGQVGDEKFATIDELIEKAQGVATKPTWPISRQGLDSQILPPTYWGLSVDQVRLAILIKAKQWGFPLLSSLFQTPQQNQEQQQQQVLNGTNCVDNNTSSSSSVTTLNNETIRTLIYKSLHEFQPWFHGKISREEAEKRIEDGHPRDGKFLVRERDNYSYAMCICHKKTTKHYRIDVLPTGELAIQDGRKFTSLMALVSHYTIMSDGLWCALTEACPRPIQNSGSINNPITNKNIQASCITVPFGNNNNNLTGLQSIPPCHISAPQPINNSYNQMINQNLYCIPPKLTIGTTPTNHRNSKTSHNNHINLSSIGYDTSKNNNNSIETNSKCQTSSSLICANQGGVNSIKVPIKEWLQNINQKWSQLIAAKNQHQSLNSFLFGSQNPLNNHCRHGHNRHNHNHHHHHHVGHRKRTCKNGHASCACIQMQMNSSNQLALGNTPLDYHKNNQQLSRLDESKVKCLEQIPSRVLPSNYWNYCPTMKTLSNNNNMIEKNSTTIQQATDQNKTTMLSCMPQNSGFALNSHSFIGSPLFAVKTNLQVNDALNNNANRVHGTLENIQNSGSCSNGEQITSTMTNEFEGKLISPAQSISADLNNSATTHVNSNNNTYHINNDIYGSQTSTAIVHDRLPTTSSSSSSGCHNKNNFLNNTFNVKQNIINNTSSFKQPTSNMEPIMIIPKAKASNDINNHSGLIICGQHAGPAYRYTNFQDENSYKPCYHRPFVSGNRAIDDLQLITPSTQLTGPAAMTKFVQFQDGQCLRTHRDTRSIQMAYLSSRQVSQQNQHNLPTNNQVPLRELNNERNFNNNENQKAYPSYQTNSGGNILPKNSHYPAANINSEQSTFKNQFPINNYKCENRDCNEIDLMDCGENNGFDFKYDFKLIKSSSIETLCGAGREGEEEPMEDLSDFKTNSELLMSLQSCWGSNQYQNAEILNPTTVDKNYSNLVMDNSNCLNLETTESNQQLSDNLIDSSLMTYNNNNNNNHNETYDHMKKKHDLDEVTTAILAELTASLRAQVDLKNKRAGFVLNNSEKITNQSQRELSNQNISTCPNSNVNLQHQQQSVFEPNPTELINEFDTIIHSNNR